MPLATFAERTVRTCHFEGAPSTAPCAAIVEPFADGTFVTYGARAKDAYGLTGEDLWIGFAAGRQADPNEPIAVYTRKSTGIGAGAGIDIVLLPVDFDGSPGRTTRDFVNSARNLIVAGYLAHADITLRRDKWNFYINPVTAGLSQTGSGANVSRSVTAPANWSRVAPIADTVGYVHNLDAASWRDFANFGGTGIGHFTIRATAPGTIVHETGHAFFGLSDEYCCDGGTIATTWPHVNIFTAQQPCQDSASAHGVPTAACQQLTTTALGVCGGLDGAGNPVLGPTNNLWRQDTPPDLMGCGANNGAAGGVLCAARIGWVYDRY